MKMKDLKEPETVLLECILCKETAILPREVIESRDKKKSAFRYLNLVTTAIDDLWRLIQEKGSCLNIDEYDLLKVTKVNLYEIMRRVYQIEY